MGGKTAMKVALSYPERVERLIVVDMAPRAYEPHHTHLLDALGRIDPEEYDSRDAVDAALAEDVPSWPIRQFLLKNLSYDGEKYEWKMNLEAIRNHYEALNERLDGESPYEDPALFVRGGASDYVTDEDTSDIYQLFPGAQIETIEGAGHWVHADQPEELARVVTSFLSTE